MTADDHAYKCSRVIEVYGDTGGGYAAVRKLMEELNYPRRLVRLEQAMTPSIVLSTLTLLPKAMPPVIRMAAAAITALSAAAWVWLSIRRKKYCMFTYGLPQSVEKELSMQKIHAFYTHTAPEQGLLEAAMEHRADVPSMPYLRLYAFLTGKQGWRGTRILASIEGGQEYLSITSPVLAAPMKVPLATGTVPGWAAGRPLTAAVSPHKVILAESTDTLALAAGLFIKERPLIYRQEE